MTPDKKVGHKATEVTNTARPAKITAHQIDLADAATTIDEASGLINGVTPLVQLFRREVAEALAEHPGGYDIPQAHGPNKHSDFGKDRDFKRFYGWEKYRTQYAFHELAVEWSRIFGLDTLVDSSNTERTATVLRMLIGTLCETVFSLSQIEGVEYVDEQTAKVRSNPILIRHLRALINKDPLAGAQVIAKLLDCLGVIPRDSMIDSGLSNFLQETVDKVIKLTETDPRKKMLLQKLEASKAVRTNLDLYISMDTFLELYRGNRQALLLKVGDSDSKWGRGSFTIGDDVYEHKSKLADEAIRHIEALFDLKTDGDLHSAKKHAASQIVEVFPHGDAQKYLHPATILSRRGIATIKTQNALQKALKDADSEVRITASGALPYLEVHYDPSRMNQLITMIDNALQDEQLTVRLNASRALPALVRTFAFFMPNYTFKEHPGEENKHAQCLTDLFNLLECINHTLERSLSKGELDIATQAATALAELKTCHLDTPAILNVARVGIGQVLQHEHLRSKLGTTRGVHTLGTGPSAELLVRISESDSFSPTEKKWAREEGEKVRYQERQLHTVSGWPD